MSDEKRKSCRTQGRYSDGPARKDKDKRHSKGSGLDRDVEKKSKSESREVEGLSLEYDPTATVNLKEFEEKKKSLEIKTPGIQELSKTDNGQSRIIFEPNLIEKDEAEELMMKLRSTTKWYDKNIVIHGEEVRQPRLVAWYGPFPYSYSGAVLEPAEMPSTVLYIKSRVEEYLKKEHELDVELNSVLLNLYRDEHDSVAWHSDDELSMGMFPTIASVSLGEVRKFELKPNRHVTEKTLDSDIVYLNLTPGSLVVMDGAMQEDWKHRVPKEFHRKDPRINLTFRQVFPTDKTPKGSGKPVVSSPKTESAKDTDSSKSKLDTASSPPFRPSDEDFPSLNGESETPPESYEESNSVTPPPETSENGGKETEESPVSGPTISASDDSPDTNENFHDAIEHPPSDTASIVETSTLNANAPLFVPTCQKPEVLPQPFAMLSLQRLAEMYLDKQVEESQFSNYLAALISKIMRETSSVDFFSRRDHHELKVLLQLLGDSELPIRHQDLITSRMCDMIQNADYQRRRDDCSSYSYRGGRGRDYYGQSKRPYRR